MLGRCSKRILSFQFPGKQDGAVIPRRPGKSDLVPANLVRFQMEVEGAAVRVYGGVLGGVGVVDHAVFSVLYKGMNLNVVIARVPFVKRVFPVGSPQDGTVEQAAVGEAVRQAGDIHAPPPAAFVGCQLYLFVPLDQNLCAIQGINALLALAEVHGVPASARMK